MIPIKDNLYKRKTPLITYLLIGLNTFIFLYQLGLNHYQLQVLFYQYGLVPAFLTDPGLAARYGLEVSFLLPFISSTFLHANLGHLLGNMWALWIFGDDIEDYLGHFRYLIFYLATGAGAGVIHLITNLNSTVPTIGASGAVAGLMGAFFILYPRAKIAALVPIFFFFTMINIPAFFYLGIWFLIQLYYGAATLGADLAGGIAWWAHVGGFLLGIFLLRYFR